MSTFLAKAEAAWGSPPEWVIALANACDRQTQAKVARLLNVNQAYVSYAIRGEKFDYHARVEEGVRAILMGEVIECPVLGELAPDVCGRHRRAKQRPLGPVEKALRSACPTCIHNRNSEETDDAEQ